jgi:phospholipid/cholesterol/gamma-HCH transport system substrate-binding protein
VNRETFQSFGLGLFVAGGLAAIVVLVVWFTRSRGVLDPGANAYTIVFADAPGVRVGTPVRRSGVPVGQVTAVALDDENNRVVVTARLDPKYVPRAADEPVVNQNLITADTFIDFVPKKLAPGEKPDLTPVPPGGSFTAREPTDARTLIDRTTALLPTAQESLAQIRRSVERVERLTPQVEEAFREFAAVSRAGRELVPELRRTNDAAREFLVTQVGPLAGAPAVAGAQGDQPDARRQGIRATSEKIAAAAAELQTASKAVTRFIERLDDIVVENRKKVTQTIDNLNTALGPKNQEQLAKTLQNLAEVSESLKPASKRAEQLAAEAEKSLQKLGEAASSAEATLKEFRPAAKALGERGPQISRNVDEASAQLAKLVPELRELVQAIGRSDGTIAKLLSDPSLFNNIDCFAAGLARLTPRLERILNDIETFANKLARHPELLGVRGAIRPDSGLTDDPGPAAGARPRLLPR